MLKPNRLWFLLNWQAWAVLLMGAVTTVVVSLATRSNQGWLITLGVIGYLVVLLFDILSGGSLGRSAQVRLAQAEQENRSLRAEQVRLIAGLKEAQASYESVQKQMAELKATLDAAQAEIARLKTAGPT
jgi:peptidoglycan hydrolase CwlO-like protein